MLDRIWGAHEVAPGLIYIDLHLVHEVTSPQAFEGLRLAGRSVRRPDRTLATADHNVPTDGTRARPDHRRALTRPGPDARAQLRAVRRPLYSVGSDRQGIVHVIGPELGVTQPGMTIVCGDSHTATHGAFGALAFGIGTSEVEHVLATQCLVQTQAAAMRIRYEGERGFGVTAKDLILATIGQIGVDGAVGHVVEYTGPAIDELSMEGRMTVCNMTIEAGGRAGMVAPDDVTFEWFERVRGPAPARGRSSRGRSRVGASFAATPDAASTARSWSTSRRSRRRSHGEPTPGMVVGVADRVPSPDDFEAPGDRDAAERALAYMDLGPGPRSRDPPRPRVHRLVHELADRRPAGRSVGDLAAAASPSSQRDGRAGLGGRQRAGRGGRPRRRVPGRRLRLAHGRLFDVPRHESRHPRAGRALRVDLQPQLRGPPGARRAHPPRLARRWRPRPRSKAVSSTSATWS